MNFRGINPVFFRKSKEATPPPNFCTASMSGEHRSGSLLDDDAEIARILQEEELELARQQQQSAQGPRGRTGQPQAHNRNGVVPTGQTLLLRTNNTNTHLDWFICFFTLPSKNLWLQSHAVVLSVGKQC